MEKIKKININGNIVDIDKGCVKLVTLFNNIGIETEFCCDGHEKDNFYILFSDKVTDLDVLNIIKGCSNDDCTLLCGSLKNWIKKASEEIKKDHCELVIMLIPARTDTTYFHQYIYKKENVEIDFLK